MANICNSFDLFFGQWHDSVYRLCFMLSRSPHDALELTFQAFLRLGAAKNAEIGESEAKRLLYSSALRLCDDYFLKKMRRRPKRDALKKAASFPVTDSLVSALDLPFARRAALCLTLDGFSPEEIAAMLHSSGRLAAHSSSAPDIHGWQEALLSIALTQEEADALSDRIYDRFSERNVALENSIHGLRSSFDRAAPLLALGVLALFALAIWYTGQL
ncbi:MAG: hypothetical protein Q4F18_01455 [Clostridia bacterium]|nr:hypothetical protein [Clostridia bacterium]